MRDHEAVWWDIHGRPVQSTEGMTFPYQCTRCGHVHDGASVTVVARYTDCSVWQCPKCKSQIDDRPIGWGGSARKMF